MKYLILLSSLFLCFQVRGQELDMDSELSKLVPYLQALDNFSKRFPQEKVYLHFDNTSYYQGDRIWFKCYVTSAQHQLSNLSKTLYVELLNPGGEIVDKRILKIENGQCHGDFTLNYLPFYSGFYEVRAYTKYMLDFGDDIIFSRLLPVFDKPKSEGNFEEKAMLPYGRWGPAGGFPMKRERPERGKTVNLRFFPEGGNMVQGIASRVAFEATDEAGNPIDITGAVLDGAKQEVGVFASSHEGRGMFIYTPGADKQKDVATVEYSGRTYQFDLPAGLTQGVVMEVDNLTDSDSIRIILRKNRHTPSGLFGVTVLHGGGLYDYCIVHVADNELNFKLDKTQLPSGVLQIVLFNGDGEILCDRLIFTHRNDQLEIKAKTGKAVYNPYELVDMEISVTDTEANSVPATFSLSVRDGANEVESNHNILTGLLLMSEIKGYVRNPAYYFEGKNDTVEARRAASLDLLLMVQGWRRYSWKQMAGVEPFEPEFFPEQGIEIHGKVVGFDMRQTLKSNVDVDLLLLKKTETDATGGSFVETFVTDHQGRFSFVADVEGVWNMTLAVTEKRKKRNYQIILDRAFSPEPKRYRYTDLQVTVAENIIEIENTNDETPDNNFENDWDSFLVAYNDSLAKLGVDQKVNRLEEVTITAKRRTREQEIYQIKSTSVAHYDVQTEFDNIYDSGKYISDDIHELLKNMDQDFSTTRGSTGIEWMLYQGMPAFFVVNNKVVDVSNLESVIEYQIIKIQAIKSTYINKTLSVYCKYLYHPRVGFLCGADDFYIGCVVFIETWPEEEISTKGAKGVRKTWLEGYSRVNEFYNPNYSKLPPVSDDYRRTLYWNPAVIPDKNGKAKIQFYNNSSCRNFSISAETVTSSGMIGILKNEK